MRRFFLVATTRGGTIADRGSQDASLGESVDPPAAVGGCLAGGERVAKPTPISMAGGEGGPIWDGGSLVAAHAAKREDVESRRRPSCRCCSHPASSASRC